MHEPSILVTMAEEKQMFSCFHSQKSVNPEFAEEQEKNKSETFRTHKWSEMKFVYGRQTANMDSRMDDHDPSRANKLFNQLVGAAPQLSDSRDAGDKEAPAHRNTVDGEIRL